jgi:hypothetical protein
MYILISGDCSWHRVVHALQFSSKTHVVWLRQLRLKAYWFLWNLVAFHTGLLYILSSNIIFRWKMQSMDNSMRTTISDVPHILIVSRNLQDKTQLFSDGLRRRFKKGFVDSPSNLLDKTISSHWHFYTLKSSYIHIYWQVSLKIWNH